MNLLPNPSGNESNTEPADTDLAHASLQRSMAWLLTFSCFLGTLLLASVAANAQPKTASAMLDLPELPQPQNAAPAAAQPSPCLIKRAAIGAGWAGAAAAPSPGSEAAAAGAASAIGKPIVKTADEIDTALVPCTTAEHILNSLQLVKKLPMVNWYARFLDGPQVKPMTPKEKAWLAVRDVADPFNAITIMGSSAVAVASNSHSGYGPGFPGWGRYVGVSYTQDITGEFFGTFLIPTIVHQDPHYHRMPASSLKRRIAHVIYQVAWTQGDNGKGMINYADLLGFGIDDEIANLYVPDRETRASATAQRYGISLALAPVDNAITEFIPDIARKIHIRVVLIQQIINQVANKDAAVSAP
jgi:hypothetical protein